MEKTKTVGYFCALLATLIWSGNFIIARGLGDVLPPVTLAAFRWTTATVVLLPFVFGVMWRERKIIRKHFKYLLVSAILGVTVFNTLIYLSAHTTDAMNLTLIATTTPAFVVILSRMFLGEPITRFRAIGLAAAIAGIVTLVTRGDYAVLRDLSFRVGDIWMLMAGFLWAAYSILIKKKPQEISTYSFLGVTFLLGVLPLIPAALVEQPFYPQWTLTPTIIGAVIYIGVGASLVSYFLWTQAVAIIGPTTASFVYYALPVFSGVEAYFILGEPVTWAHGVGFALIFSGIVVATHPRFNARHC
ncbi:MAG: DMT family transporter [Pseudodesulfovibrio sp.]|nr:DMT family transporter [Pseudodesulfovibrio sp.]